MGLGQGSIRSSSHCDFHKEVQPWKHGEFSVELGSKHTPPALRLRGRKPWVLWVPGRLGANRTLSPPTYNCSIRDTLPHQGGLRLLEEKLDRAP